MLENFPSSLVAHSDAARALEPTAAEQAHMAHVVHQFVSDLIDGLPKVDLYSSTSPNEAIADLLGPPPEGPGEFDAVFARVVDALSLGIQDQSPGNFAFIAGSSTYTSALGEFITKAANPHAIFPYLSPALVAMEQGLIRWMCREFDLPNTAAGIFTTGGSMSALTAIVAARDDRLGEQFLDGVIYVGSHAHHCLAKAARIAGFPASAIRVVPSDHLFHIDLGALGSMIAEDRAAGRRPFLVAATAGTIHSGAVDPLEGVAALARREGLWFHADAAYGGFFQLTQRGRTRLAGISSADSIMLDPHKAMFMPHGTGTLLVRDEASLRHAFSATASYLQDLDEDYGLPSSSQNGLELTRDFRGLRMWLPLQLHGRGAFAAALDEKLDLAEYAYRELSSDPLLEVPLRPELSIVTFRLRDGGEERCRQLLARCNESKRIFISSTVMDGTFMLRLCVLNHRTHADRVAEAVEIIRDAARDLSLAHTT